MPKSVEIVVGAIIGLIVWFILTLIFAIIPVIGWILYWFVAPVVAGYVAGKYGGIWAAVILALICPALAWVLGTLLISMVMGQLGLLGSFHEQWITIGFDVFIALWALFNLMFVGAGGWMGNAARSPEHVIVETSGQRETRIEPRRHPSDSSKTFSYPDYDDLVKKRILGYLLAFKQVNLKTLTSRYDLVMEEVENIIFEHLADGKVKGSINPKNKIFTVED